MLARRNQRTRSRESRDSRHRYPAVKLRVLFLATRDWYNPATTGGDNTMWENARYLASVGHEVTFVAAGYRGAAKGETLDGVKVVRLGGIHSLWLTTFAYYMARCRGKYDVVVAEGFGGSRIPRLTPIYVKEPIITEWHQVHRDLFAVQYPKLMNGPLNLLERITAWVHRDTLVRAGTEEVRQAFLRLGFKAENVFVVPVSIGEDWLSSLTPPLNLASDLPIRRSAPPSPQAGKQVLWLGKLRRYKCPDHLVRAMAEVVKHEPSTRLVLAIRRDDRKYEGELRRLVDELHLHAHVEFRLDVSEEEKRDLFRSSRVVVVPSAVEGFGIVVLEANACGVPVVASSGVPEGAVREGFNGLRYPFGDIQALAGRIIEVLRDDTLYSQLSKNALENVERFRWSRVGPQFEQVVARSAEVPR